LLLQFFLLTEVSCCGCTVHCSALNCYHPNCYHQTTDCRLRPGAATWRTGRNVFDLGPLYGNMMPSTKTEVHKVSHCQQRKTEPRPQVTHAENMVKFGQWFLINASGHTDKETDTLITILSTPTGGEVITNYK